MAVSAQVRLEVEFGATPAPDALDAAKAANLHYVSDSQPGISRERNRHFLYRDEAGRQIRDAAVIARIEALAIPPAWTKVWICSLPNGHIQATGRDARGRKQYRYHARWRTVRDETKYARILEFAEALPAIRRRLDADLARPGLPRDKVLAAVARLMELTLARVGNPEYARQNQSFGLTTLKNRHVHISKGKIELDFNAKSNIRHRSVVSDRKLARILKNCRDLPGSELFQFVDEQGQRHSIDSSDLNDYLRTISGRDISSKDFRTWAATNLAVLEFCALQEDKPSKKSELSVIKKVASQLGHTAAVCRKCYIHPAVLAGYHSGYLSASLAGVISEEFPAEIWVAERKIIRFLKTAAERGLVDSLKRSLKCTRAKRRAVNSWRFPEARN